MSLFRKMFGTYSDRELKKIKPIADKVLELEPVFQKYTDQELQQMTPKFKERLQNGETLEDILPEAFAVCREASSRILGMKHFPVQVIGGIVLHEGRIAEMKTGEGKTLVATLPAYLNALTGKGVHIVTVNDYLARRDSEWMGKLYRFLGLSVGLVVAGLDPQQRKEQYACDITYGTNNELGFDYLRDNMVIYQKDKVQRGHNFAIVDEVDSILIDEARTPLIISGRGDKSTDLYTQADKFARTLKMIKVAELDAKQEQDTIDGDYIVDEKAKTATLTPRGTKAAEAYFHVDNLMSAEQMTLLHHINQAVKAHGVMQRDQDYIVKDGKVIIVDEFTGRLMIGRRYNEGLHQAIEAKENVKVERESRTLATITFQNYFRMYRKLSGMTGTALTEEDEFQEIYSLDIVEVPTNKPMIRKDYPDVIYKTEKAKMNAVIDKIAECHEKGQPVLVGTVTIDKSELFSRMLKKRGIKHEVLNAKFHEKEAEIVAQAGQYGAVTIATNMAGRGTDITLGGNADFLAKADMRKEGFPETLIEEATSFGETKDEEILNARQVYRALKEKHNETIKKEAEKVIAAGGLFILGTERHESRRIDNQLRGRSGRQGDPGASQFFLSLEDDLMRLFGGERVQNMMNFMRADEDMPIEAKMLSGIIENAQRKVEGRNFQIRKNVLQFDDVMNKQREIIYSQRDKVLEGQDVSDYIKQMLTESVENTVCTYVSDTEEHEDWNLVGLREHYMGLLTTEEDFRYTPQQLEDTSRKEIIDLLTERVMNLYRRREEELTPPIMREVERVVLLRNVDMKWMDHIDAMDELRKGMYLRSYGQHDPVVEYRVEGFEMFDQMVNAIKEDTAKMVLTVKVNREEAPKREQVAKPIEPQSEEKKQPVKAGAKVGRNDPCPCGSGLKYKKCCGR